MCDQLGIIPIFSSPREGYLKLLDEHPPAVIQWTEVKYAAGGRVRGISLPIQPTRGCEKKGK